MSENDKSVEDKPLDDEVSLNGSGDDSQTSEDTETIDESQVENEDVGTPTYEELVDKKEELESLLLRANADLDNALKRTLTEVEKAHKYGTERLLMELLPIIDNLENALNNLSDNSSKEDKEGIELTLKSFSKSFNFFFAMFCFFSLKKF